MKIVSINIALPELVSLGNSPKKYRSGIYKTPWADPILLNPQGLQGDGVGDTKIHGGSDKAVCVYCVEHYPFWSEKLQREIDPGSFGENFSIEGLCEASVHIGDIFEVGSAQVQITQPRQPCHKLNKVFDDQSLACNFKSTGFTGYYLRVLKSGKIDTGSSIKKIYNDPAKFSIEDANALLRKGGSNIEQMENLISLQALSEEWKEMFKKRLLKFKNKQG